VLRLDDRTGNVLTTIAAFAAVVAVAYTVRALIVAAVLGLLLAYLLEPIVAWLERLLSGHSRHARGMAIAAVYGIGALMAIGAAYSVVPAVVDQFHRLQESVPAVQARVDAVRGTGLGRAISGVMPGATRTVVSTVENGAWLLMAPVLAVFFLGDRAALLDGTVDLFARQGDRRRAKRTVQQVDLTLAGYTRAQLALAALSAAFYTIAMLVLRVPYSLALGILGGALELVPIVGWIVAATAILLSASVAGAQWVLMAVLIVAWRLVLNFVISPRIMGDRLDMKPSSVLVGLLIGSQVAGFAGAILSVPAIAVCRVVWQERTSRETAPAALVQR
jgi:predicted PurR-regulated permease PerM